MQNRRTLGLQTLLLTSCVVHSLPISRDELYFRCFRYLCLNSLMIWIRSIKIVIINCSTIRRKCSLDIFVKWRFRQNPYLLMSLFVILSLLLFSSRYILSVLLSYIGCVSSNSHAPLHPHPYFEMMFLAEAFETALPLFINNDQQFTESPVGNPQNFLQSISQLWLGFDLHLCASLSKIKYYPHFCVSWSVIFILIITLNLMCIFMVIIINITIWKSSPWFSLSFPLPSLSSSLLVINGRYYNKIFQSHKPLLRFVA